MSTMTVQGAARFSRTVYDTDRQTVSPFDWKRWPHQPRRYVRRMGLVEYFFNTMATLHEGRTDIFYRLPLSCPKASLDQLLGRIPLAWALMCRRHPLLCARVVNLTPDLQQVSEQEAKAMRQSGESAQDASVSFEPHFLIDYPETISGLLDKASSRVVWLPSDWRKTHPSDSPSEAAVAWMESHVWNGKRHFLHNENAFELASLVVMPPLADQDTVSFDIVILAAHCIGDGLSVAELAAELLQALTSDVLPGDLPELHHQLECQRDLEDSTIASYRTVTPEMLAAIVGTDTVHPPLAKLSTTELEYLLPPCLEASFPDILPTSLPSDTEQARSSRQARLRWFWSIRRVICQARALKAQDQLLTDFKAERTDYPVEPWWGAQTRWSVVRISKETTSALTRLSKQKKVRVGALLYSVATLALNTLEKEDPTSIPGSSNQTVIGFPMSIRKYLDPVTANLDNVRPKVSLSEANKPSSLGVRLGFGGVSLPPPAIFCLEPTNEDQTRHLAPYQKAQIWQVARQAQRQFDAMFRQPHLLVADGFVVALERENRFRQSGVQDVFQASAAKDQSSQNVPGADERQPGVTKKNMQGPGSSLNFSMVGHLDPILPTSLPLSRGGTLEVGPNLLIGVRNRAGEAFGTSFTFRGQLNLELGHDGVVWDTIKVHRYLSLMEVIVQNLVEF